MLSRRMFGGGVIAGLSGFLFPARNAFSAEEEEIFKIVLVGSREIGAARTDIEQIESLISEGNE